MHYTYIYFCHVPFSFPGLLATVVYSVVFPFWQLAWVQVTDGMRLLVTCWLSSVDETPLLLAGNYAYVQIEARGKAWFQYCGSERDRSKWRIYGGER